MKTACRRAAALMLGLALMGCASDGSVRESRLLQLRQEPSITAVRYTPSVFELVLPEATVHTGIGFMSGSGGGSGMGAGVSVGGGNGSRPAPEMASQFSLRDPALRVRDSFVAGLGREYGFQNIRPAEEALTDETMRYLSGRLGPGPVIDFRTTYWALAAYSRKHALFHTPLKVRARIVSPGEGKVLWSAYCSFKREKDAQSPTLEKATARGGAELKRMLDVASDECARELLQKLKKFR